MPHLTDIMRRAHQIGRHYRGEITFSEALRMSWAIARGDSAGFELSHSNGKGGQVRVTAFFKSTDEARAARIAKHNEVVARGLKPSASHEFSLRRFMPVQQEIETAPMALKHAA
jgi:hypothetical protein